MTIYEKELQTLKPHDKVEYTDEHGFINTQGHGYLIVKRTDENIEKYKIAEQCCSKYSFKGSHAIYLEEDCDATKFVKLTKGANH